MKNQAIYRRIPVDYTPMQDLSINIKMMPQAFRGCHLLLVITCDQTVMIWKRSYGYQIFFIIFVKYVVYDWG